NMHQASVCYRVFPVSLNQCVPSSNAGRVSQSQRDRWDGASAADRETVALAERAAWGWPLEGGSGTDTAIGRLGSKSNPQRHSRTASRRGYWTQSEPWEGPAEESGPHPERATARCAVPGKEGIMVGVRWGSGQRWPAFRISPAVVRALAAGLFTLSIAAGPCAPRAGANGYTITDLGTMDGDSSIANGINNS